MSRWISYDSEHYSFYAHPESYAEKHFADISRTQEQCFSEICAITGIRFDKKIRYFLCDSCDEVGLLTTGTPCNACTFDYDLIYAVYNEDIQCIGHHEDAHLISYSVAIPDSMFIREGFAMMFDKAWHGKKNSDIVASIERYSIASLFDNDYFYSLPDDVTYPLSGVFAEYLVKRFGMEKYLSFYKEPCKVEAVFGSDLAAIEAEFYK